MKNELFCEQNSNDFFFFFFLLIKKQFLCCIPKLFCYRKWKMDFGQISNLRQRLTGFHILVWREGGRQRREFFAFHRSSTLPGHLTLLFLSLFFIFFCHDSLLLLSVPPPARLNKFSDESIIRSNCGPIRPFFFFFRFYKFIIYIIGVLRRE